jgi:hypothetical protein
MSKIVYEESCVIGLKKLEDATVDVCFFVVPEACQESTTECVKNTKTMAKKIIRVMKPGGVLWLRVFDRAASQGGLCGIPSSTASALIKDGWLLQETLFWDAVSSTDPDMPSTKKPSILFAFSKGAVAEKCLEKDKTESVAINVVDNRRFVFAAIRENQEVSCIERSCPLDGVVLDPFMSDKNVMDACDILKLNFIGFKAQ